MEVGEMQFLDSLGNFYLVKFILLAIFLYVIVHLINKLIHAALKNIKISTEEKRKTFEAVTRSLFNYLMLIALIVFALKPFVDLTGLLAGAGVLGIVLGIALRKPLQDVFLGLIRLHEKQMIVGDYVTTTINRVTHSGTVEEIGIRSLTIRKWDGKLLMVSHSDIMEIENSNKGKMRVVEKLVISYKEDPDRIKKLMDNLCIQCNEKYGHYLLVDKNGEKVQEFEFSGITNTNVDFHGYEVAVAGVVEPQHYSEASKEIRYELIKLTHKEEIRLAESNVYHRTRLTTKA
jgi:small-conductance mechanosensitive channel